MAGIPSVIDPIIDPLEPVNGPIWPNCRNSFLKAVQYGSILVNSGQFGQFGHVGGGPHGVGRCCLGARPPVPGPPPGSLGTPWPPGHPWPCTTHGHAAARVHHPHVLEGLAHPELMLGRPGRILRRRVGLARPNPALGLINLARPD